MLRGALHVHSTYSDGDYTLAELKRVLGGSGCRFVCVTDHADSFDQSKADAYRRECESLSDQHFLFVPGLEYSCAARMHILGYGHLSPIASLDPLEVIARIQRGGGIAVIAHPKDDAFAAIEGFDPAPDGLEVWNSKYDGQYAPRPATFGLLKRLQARRPGTRAFYGLDLHWRHQNRELFVEVDRDQLRADAILSALACGDYEAVKGDLRMPSAGDLPAAVLARFAAAQARSRRLRGWIARVKSLADRTGVRVPPMVKAQLRRIF